MAEQIPKEFNNVALSNTVMLSIVTKFHRSCSVLCQRKGKYGRPLTVSTNENHACSSADTAFAPTKPATNGLETKRHWYVRSPIV